MCTSTISQFESSRAISIQNFSCVRLLEGPQKFKVCMFLILYLKRRGITSLDRQFSRKILLIFSKLNALFRSMKSSNEFKKTRLDLFCTNLKIVLKFK